MQSFAFLVRPFAERRTYLTTLYLLLGLPLGVFWFTVLVTFASVGLGMLITLVGIPILVATLLLARWCGHTERLRARGLLGVEVADPVPLPRSGSNWWWRGLRQLVTDSLTWRSFLYGILLLPIGIIGFTVTVTFWATGLGGVTLPAWNWAVPGGAQIFGPNQVDTWWELAAAVAGGVVVLLVTPWVVRGLGAAAGAIVRGLLGTSRREIDDRLAALEAARAQSVESAAMDRRRIERDLHDGAQQRLVALAMDLGRAREKLEAGGDPEDVSVLVTTAHEDAKQALKELRDLARGIHPAVLTDRGLDAALSAVAARSTVPVDIHVDVPVRPSPAIESIAYFVVAESLANVSKHSGARSAKVDVVRHPQLLVVRVEDDGHGGANQASGTGLAGLAERVRSVDGRFQVLSPTGGPTTILAELPCAS
jgi:signal transduction histidine kinase